MITAICIASGPSLTQEDVDYCLAKEARVYVVNDTYKLAPWADYLYACDAAWWDHHNGAPDFHGEKWTINTAAAVKYNLKHINGKNDLAFSEKKTQLATGFNSGFQAMNLAVLHGATKVILLGYDMQISNKEKKHWFGNHPKELDRTPDFPKWISKFEKAAPLIKAKVINCTRETALKCFPRMELRNVI